MTKYSQSNTLQVNSSQRKIGLLKRLARVIGATGFIVFFAFAVRVGYCGRDFAPFSGTSLYGGETGAIAAAIASGRGFSSPLPRIQTGATAWLAPIYPYLLAGIFKLAGIFTFRSMFVIRVLDIVFSALTCWPIRSAGTVAFGKRVGTAS